MSDIHEGFFQIALELQPGEKFGEVVRQNEERLREVYRTFTESRRNFPLFGSEERFYKNGDSGNLLLSEFQLWGQSFPGLVFLISHIYFRSLYVQVYRVTGSEVQIVASFNGVEDGRVGPFRANMCVNEIQFDHEITHLFAPRSKEKKPEPPPEINIPPTQMIRVSPGSSSPVSSELLSSYFLPSVSIASSPEVSMAIASPSPPVVTMAPASPPRTFAELLGLPVFQ